MAQYKISKELVSDIEYMKDLGANAVCFMKPGQSAPRILGSTVSNDLTMCFYKLEDENLHLLKKQERLTSLEDLQQALRDASFEAALPNTVSTFTIEGVEIYFYAGDPLEELRKNDGSEKFPINVDVNYSLVYFNIDDLLAAKNRSTDEIYLTDNIRIYNNLSAVELDTVHWDGNTKFGTLIASPEATIATKFTHKESLAPTEGKPCPPFWQMGLYNFIIKPILSKDVLFETRVANLLSKNRESLPIPQKHPEVIKKHQKSSSKIAKKR